MPEKWETIFGNSRKEVAEEAKRRGIVVVVPPDQGPMRPYVYRDCGKLIGAYWAPVSAGFGYSELAEAFLGADGTALVFPWMGIPRANRFTGKWELCRYEHCGSYEEKLKLGETLDPMIRKELEKAMRESEEAYQRKQEILKSWEKAPRDEWGNIIGYDDE